MRRALFVLILVPFAVAQLIRKPVKLINVKNLSDLKIKLKAAGDKMVVLGFLPRACPHSRKLIPHVEKLARQYGNSIVFLRVYEGHDDIFNAYKVNSVPTFIYLKMSRPFTRRTGSSINELVKVIDASRIDEHVLNAVNSQYPEEEGQLYEIECYDDFKGRLAEAKDKLVVVAFMPSYCAISYAMIPEVAKLAKKYKSTTSFIRVKEEHDDIYEVFGIRAVPTFIFMQDRKKLTVRSGGGIKQLTATLEAVLTGDYTSTTTTTQKPTSHIIDVADPEDLKAKLDAAGNKLVVVSFLTKWCSKSKIIGPRIEDMADEYYGSVVFLRVSDDGRNTEIYKAYKIQRVPTFVFVRNSKKINQYEGTEYQKIKTRIELQEFLN